MTKMRVDTVPFLLKPLLWLYGTIVGTLFYLYFYFLHLTCRISFEGADPEVLAKPHIIACWHCYNVPYFVTFIHHSPKHAWMSHPAWYMAHVHVLLRCMGIEKLIMGSSHNDGRKAAGEIVGLLRQGYSSYLNPDGPYGPVFSAKPGVLRMSHEAQVPIVGLKIDVSHKLVLTKTWEHKQVPWPFAKIVVRYSEPYWATADFTAGKLEIEKRLGMLPPS